MICFLKAFANISKSTHSKSTELTRLSGSKIRRVDNEYPNKKRQDDEEDKNEVFDEDLEDDNYT